MACTFYRDKVAADRCQRREYISTEEGTSPASRRRKKEGKRVEMSEREGEEEGRWKDRWVERERDRASIERTRANDRRKFDE